MTRRLIVGVGNPGKRYEGTRHNIGFLTADHLVEKYCGSAFKHIPSLHSDIVKGVACNRDVIVAKPDTYVNLSGRAVVLLSKYFEISPENILVIADDVNKPLGRVQCRYQGGTGGHNGLKSVAQSLGSTCYWQLRLGIGRPIDQQGLSDFVLGRFSSEEMVVLETMVQQGIAQIENWLHRSHDDPNQSK